MIKHTGYSIHSLINWTNNGLPGTTKRHFFAWHPLLNCLKQNRRHGWSVSGSASLSQLAWLASLSLLVYHAVLPFMPNTATFWFILTDEKFLHRGKLQECLAIFSSVYSLLSFLNILVTTPVSPVPSGCRLWPWALLHQTSGLSGLRLRLHSHTHLWYLHLHRPVSGLKIPWERWGRGMTSVGW